MSSMACQLFFTVFVAFAKLASTTLTVEPVDTEVMVGQMVTLNCSTSSVNGGVKWYHISVGNEPAQKTIIYGNYRVYPPNEKHIHVDRTFTTAGSNPFNLVIQNVRMEDAGRYQCEDEATGNRSMAQLIVLTSSPICTSNIDSYEVIGQNSCNMEPELLNLSCSVSYYGGATPVMSWKKSGDSSQLNSMSYEYQENLTVATLSLKGDLAINGASYTCQSTRARNAQYSCTSKNVRIIYAFSNFSVADKSVGHKVQCSALSSQTCSYQWFKDNAVVEGGSAEIQLQDSGLYRCQANCKIKEKSCSVVAAVVHVPVSSSRAGLIVLIVLVVIFSIAVIVLLFLLCKSYRRKEKPPIPSPDKMHSETARARETTGGVVYDAIQYEDIGYEMPNRRFSPEEGDRGYEVLSPISACKRIPRDLKDPTNEEFGEKVTLSSQYITTLTDPCKKSTDEDISLQNTRSSYLEVIYESECPKSSEDYESNRSSS